MSIKYTLVFEDLVRKKKLKYLNKFLYHYKVTFNIFIFGLKKLY